MNARPLLSVFVFVCVVFLSIGCQTTTPEFPLVEATIADIHGAMTRGELTARELVQGYLRRIEAFDKRGPALNTIITIKFNQF